MSSLLNVHKVDFSFASTKKTERYRNCTQLHFYLRSTIPHGQPFITVKINVGYLQRSWYILPI